MGSNADRRTSASCWYSRLLYSQYSKSKREAKRLKSHAQGYAGARGPESQGAIINAVEYSLSAQSRISAKEEGGTSNFFPRIFSKEHFGFLLYMRIISFILYFIYI